MNGIDVRLGSAVCPCGTGDAEIFVLAHEMATLGWARGRAIGRMGCRRCRGYVEVEVFADALGVLYLILDGAEVRIEADSFDDAVASQRW